MVAASKMINLLLIHTAGRIGMVLISNWTCQNVYHLTPLKQVCHLKCFSKLIFRPHSDLYGISKLFYILCGHFDGKKNGGSTLPGRRKSRQSQRVRGECNPFHGFFFFDILNHHLKKISAY